MKGTVAVIEGRGCNYWRGQCHGKRKLLFWARTVASECFTCGRPLKTIKRVCVLRPLNFLCLPHCVI